MKVFEIPEAGRTAKGMAIINLIRTSPGDSVASIMSLRDFGDDRLVAYATSNGTVKATPLSDFSNVKKTGIVAIKIKEDDYLIAASICYKHNDLILITKFGQSIRFSLENLRPMGRATQGVIGIRLRPEDSVIAMTINQIDCQCVITDETLPVETTQESVDDEVSKEREILFVTEKAMQNAPRSVNFVCRIAEAKDYWYPCF
jgi:DNA gyrase subunit A